MLCLNDVKSDGNSSNSILSLMDLLLYLQMDSLFRSIKILRFIQL